MRCLPSEGTAALVQNLLWVLAPLGKSSHFQPEHPSGAEESDAFGVGQNIIQAATDQGRRTMTCAFFSSPQCTQNNVRVSLYPHCQEQLSELFNFVQPQPQAAHCGEFLGLALHFRLPLPPNQVSLLEIEGTPPKGAPAMSQASLCSHIGDPVSPCYFLVWEMKH